MEAFLKYFELTERKGWRLSDLDWEGADWGKASEADRRTVAATSGIESGVPHYTRAWALTDGVSKDWELAQFVSLWAGEEERHNVALQRAAAALGVSGQAGYDVVAEIDFAALQKAHCASGCYRTIPGMLTYAAIQELVTWKFYSHAAKQSRSRFLAGLFGKIGEDEMRHHVWYREALKERFARTPVALQEAFLAPVVEAVNRFEMPHTFYKLHEEFFSGGEGLGRLARLDIKLRVVKALSFDRRVLSGLARGGWADDDIKAAAGN
jgi:hypothetical protein